MRDYYGHIGKHFVMMDVNYQNLHCAVWRQILNQKITYSDKKNRQDLGIVFMLLSCHESIKTIAIKYLG